ncbi:MAG: lysylphosphatidylglycerol synthase transmembrane domain-containing protein [Candidatus Binatia bacterium]
MKPQSRGHRFTTFSDDEVKGMRRTLSFGLKISVSIFFVLYLFSRVHWEEVWSHIKQADPLYLFLYIILAFVGILVSSLKWLVLARSHGMSPPLSALVSLYMVGYFFNNFLPTSIGGDVIRGHALGKMYTKQAEAMASVFVERFSGYTALILFAVLALFIDPALRDDIRIVAPIVFAVLAYVAIVGALVNSSWLEIGARRFPTNMIQKLLRKIRAFQQAIHMYAHERTTLLVAGLYSILFYFVSVVVVYVGCLTVQAPVSFANLVTVVPVLLIMLMIPFSFGGLGLQEWAFYFVLEIVGVPAAAGLSLGLLFRARSLGFGLIGGMIYPFVTPVDSLLAIKVPSSPSPSVTVALNGSNTLVVAGDTKSESPRF